MHDAQELMDCDGAAHIVLWLEAKEAFVVTGVLPTPINQCDRITAALHLRRSPIPLHYREEVARRNVLNAESSVPFANRTDMIVLVKDLEEGGGCRCRTSKQLDGV